MKNKILYILIILCFSISLFASQEIYISKMEKPNIDGKIEDGEWDKATLLSDFHILNSNSYENNKSLVYCGYDSENLYVAYRFYGKTPPKGDLVDDKGDYWNDDSIEIFFMGDREKEIVHQIIANGAGGYVILSNATKGNVINEARMDTADMKIDYKTLISQAYSVFGAKDEELYWEGEMSIKLKDLNIDPKNSPNAYILFCRDSRNNENYNAVFGHIYKTFYEYDNFSKINWANDETIIRVNKCDEIEVRNYNLKEKKYIFREIINGVSKEVEYLVLPGDTKVYKGTYDKGIFQTNISVISDNKTYFSMDSDICNVEIFKYNYDREKDLLLVDFDLTGQNTKSYPYIDLKLNHNEKVLVGYLINVFNEPIKHLEIDMSKFEKGKYEIDVIVKNLYSDKIVLEK